MFGADRILLQVVRSLLEAPGLSAEVWLPSDVEAGEDSIERELRGLGVTVRVLPLPILRRKDLTPRRFPGLVWRTIRLTARLARTRPYIVYCATSAALLAAPASRLAGVPFVILHIQEIWSGREAATLGLLARACTHAVAISESARASLVGRIRSRAITISNAVPDHATPPPAPIARGAGPLQFLIASRWNSWKGHETLLTAWDARDASPGELTIVGSAPEVGISVDVEGLVAGLRHPESVRVVGQVSDVIPYVDAADVMLVPSDEPEPFGLVAIEAFSRYRPVIGTNAGGLAEVVASGEDGILVPLRDAEALAAALYGMDRNSARKMGIAGRVSYENTYSIDRYLAEFARYWQSFESPR
jgi:glycosyltransferase involved in cell wall biosynthesis